jgi:predicted AAA+ superfamily ATPase
MEPWYKNTMPRAEVREGRSFNPDEFAIALEQVAANKGPEDYRDPVKFFSRTCFTRALREHIGMILRRLAGQTENTAPVMTLVTQFGGGKTHTLTALYHLAKSGSKVKSDSGVAQMLSDAGLSEVPAAKVAVFVGNAWDSGEGRETPWIDIARQLAGDAGVKALGLSAKDIPPGTDSIAKLIEVAGGSVLILCDEVLNYINRYQGDGANADKFYAFIQNLTVAMTGSQRSAAVISLPRSQVEMSDYDMQWQEKINKVVQACCQRPHRKR